MTKEVTNIEILEAINDFSNKTEIRFQNIEKELTKQGKELTKQGKELTKQRKELTKQGALMVTKDYLDDKMADQRGDLTIIMRKEDKKVSKLIDILKNKNLITEKEAKDVLSMEPFPQLSV